MANICAFMMRIIGSKESVAEMSNKLLHCNIGRVYDCSAEGPVITYDDRIYHQDFWGNCAWSVHTSMLADYTNPSLESESERLGLTIEVWAEEYGMAFQEHYIIENGTQIVSECADAVEYFLDDYESIEELNRENGTKLTIDMFEDEFYIDGGFSDYGTYIMDIGLNNRREGEEDVELTAFDDLFE